MYQSYPSGSQPSGQAPGPPVPPSVVNAVRLMYAGAVISAVTFIIGIVTIGSTRSSLRKSYPKYTTHQINTLVTVSIVFAVVVGLLSVGLWLWLAWACKKGANWARVTGTVLFGLDTLLILLSVSRLRAGIGFIVDILIWLIGLGAVILLWRRESSDYFKPGPAL